MVDKLALKCRFGIFTRLLGTCNGPFGGIEDAGTMAQVAGTTDGIETKVAAPNGVFALNLAPGRKPWVEERSTA